MALTFDPERGIIDTDREPSPLDLINRDTAIDRAVEQIKEEQKEKKKKKKEDKKPSGGGGSTPSRRVSATPRDSRDVLKKGKIIQTPGGSTKVEKETRKPSGEVLEATKVKIRDDNDVEKLLRAGAVVKTRTPGGSGRPDIVDISVPDDVKDRFEITEKTGFKTVRLKSREERGLTPDGLIFPTGDSRIADRSVLKEFTSPSRDRPVSTSEKVRDLVQFAPGSPSLFDVQKSFEGFTNVGGVFSDRAVRRSRESKGTSVEILSGSVESVLGAGLSAVGTGGELISAPEKLASGAVGFGVGVGEDVLKGISPAESDSFIGSQITRVSSSPAGFGELALIASPGVTSFFKSPKTVFVSESTLLPRGTGIKLESGQVQSTRIGLGEGTLGVKDVSVFSREALGEGKSVFDFGREKFVIERLGNDLFGKRFRSDKLIETFDIVDTSKRGRPQSEILADFESFNVKRGDVSSLVKQSSAEIERLTGKEFSGDLAKLFDVESVVTDVVVKGRKGSGEAFTEFITPDIKPGGKAQSSFDVIDLGLGKSGLDIQTVFEPKTFSTEKFTAKGKFEIFGRPTVEAQVLDFFTIRGKRGELFPGLERPTVTVPSPDIPVGRDVGGVVSGLKGITEFRRASGRDLVRSSFGVGVLDFSRSPSLERPSQLDRDLASVSVNLEVRDDILQPSRERLSSDVIPKQFSGVSTSQISTTSQVQDQVLSPDFNFDIAPTQISKTTGRPTFSTPAIVDFTTFIPPRSNIGLPSRGRSDFPVLDFGSFRVGEFVREPKSDLFSNFFSKLDFGSATDPFVTPAREREFQQSLFSGFFPTREQRRGKRDRVGEDFLNFDLEGLL